MVPYPESRSTTTLVIGNTSSSTSMVDSDVTHVFVVSERPILTDTELLCLIQAMRRAEEEVRIPLKPKFDRVMKMRNTDGRPVKYSTWKPVRILCGRDNIGTRNFKKVN